LEFAYRRLIRPALFRVGHGDAEAAHLRTLTWLRLLGTNQILKGLVAKVTGSPRDPVTVAGVRFPGRVGLAAGLDKSAAAVGAWSALGFGFAEIGTVTAQPQTGNPRPRVFRLPASAALINRMGFNNPGAALVATRLSRAGAGRAERFEIPPLGIPIGISLGKSQGVSLAEASEDYLRSFRILSEFADYLAINVSSPNTPGLRSLQQAEQLQAITSRLVAEANRLNPARPVPIFVKLSPDLEFGAVDQLLQVCHATGVSGIIATNTTTRRSGVADSEVRLGRQEGGLSGAPLGPRARRLVGYLGRVAELPIIASGGVMTADDASEMFDLGAVLVQVYTGLVYRGPGLIRRINSLRRGYLGY